MSSTPIEGEDVTDESVVDVLTDYEIAIDHASGTRELTLEATQVDLVVRTDSETRRLTPAQAEAVADVTEAMIDAGQFADSGASEFVGLLRAWADERGTGTHP